MQLEKVYLFSPVHNQYGVIDYFTNELYQALKRQGVQAKIIESDRNDPKGFLEQILHDPPQCTLSFNGLLPDAEGRFLCDLIQIPHVACLTDAPFYFFPMLQSPFNILTCVDQDFCKVFQDLKFSHLLFLPHAVSAQVAPLPVADPQYDILVLNSYIDYEKTRQSWQQKYSSALCEVLNEAAEWTLTDLSISFIQAFMQTMDKYLRLGKPLDPQALNYVEILDDLQAYIGGRGRVELLQSIKDASIHIFGSQAEGWLKHLQANRSSVHIHHPVSFFEAIELMKRAKLVINCTPEIKKGFHERLLNAMACGAAVLNLDTPFINYYFKANEEILLYRPQGYEEMNEMIHRYLQDEPARQELAQRGRKKVMEEQTWDQRAQTLKEKLPLILQEIG